MESTEAHGTEPLLSERELAAQLGVKCQTLRKWRLTGDGPDFEKLTRRCIRYAPSAVREWRQARVRRNTADTGATMGGAANAG